VSHLLPVPVRSGASEPPARSPTLPTGDEAAMKRR
jgi:hypothetical protein